MIIDILLKNIEKNISDYIYVMVQKGYSKDKVKECLINMIKKL